MSGQETLITKKRRGPKPTGVGKLVGVRLQPATLQALDEWINARAEPRPSRPEAIRALVESALGDKPKP